LIKFVCIFIFFISVQSLGKCPNLKMGWEVYKPFQFQIKGKLTGIDVDILDAVYKSLNCEYQQVKIPWKRLLLQIEGGKMDIAAGATPNKKRAKYANFSSPYSTEAVYFYTHRKFEKTLKFNSERDLIKNGLVIGVVSGAYYGPIYEELLKEKSFVKNKNIIEVTSEKQLVEMIVSKRIDGALIGGNLVNFHKDVYGFDKKIFIHHTTFMFSKKTVKPSFVKKFNKHLKALIDKGVIKGIKKKYASLKGEEYGQ